MRFLRTIPLVAALLLPATQNTSPRASASFVVSPRRAVRSISSAELRRIFLGQTTRWSDGHRIIVLVRPSHTPEGHVFLQRLMHMSDIDYAQWWIGAIFRGEAAATPRVIESPEAMLRIVAENADAIGFVEAPNGEVVTLAVDGKLPGEVGYPVGW